MPERPTCPKCGSELPPESTLGHCPRCLLAAGLGSDGASLARQGAGRPASATSVPVTVSPILGDWRETSADPGTAPLATWSAVFGTTPTISYGAVSATQNAAGVGYFDWDITSLVKSWKDGRQANYGVFLQAPGPLGDVGIADTDTPAFAPALIISSPVPEPASSGLVILSLLGLALRRRRA